MLLRFLGILLFTTLDHVISTPTTTLQTPTHQRQQQGRYLLTLCPDAQGKRYFSRIEVEQVWLEQVKPQLPPFTVATLERRHFYPTDFLVVQVGRQISNHVSGQNTTSDTGLSRNYLSVSPRICSITNDQPIRSPLAFNPFYRLPSPSTGNHQKHVDLSKVTPLTRRIGAESLWNRGYTGQRVKVGIFDTGLADDNVRFRNLRDRTNWTPEWILHDEVGHGTFVAGVVASNNHSEHRHCPGVAPDAELYIFRVFTKKQVSSTSGFLDAFNYAIHKQLDVINLSIGGPDYRDQPFVDKVREATANGILVVSAIGNDGPNWGSLNNPADQMDVLGVGGIDNEHRLAMFSSRGMTLHELPSGYGRVKPDLVTYSIDIPGITLGEGCSVMSGTSFASPVVAGSVALLISAAAEQGRRHIVNPGSIKQAFVESASFLPGMSVYEQGAGNMNLTGALEYFRTYEPKVTFHPSKLDLTVADCPSTWPHCEQPLYHTAMPKIVNITILNGVDVTGQIESVAWAPSSDIAKHLSVRFQYDEFLWPHSGYLALIITVTPSGDHLSGIAEGKIVAKVQSRNMMFELVLPLKLDIIPRPARNKRILWDQYHNLGYPVHFFPRDSLDHRNPLDVYGDHVHTNFVDLYTSWRKTGYFIEVLSEPWTCFDASNYGALIIADPEDDFGIDERWKLHQDMEKKGLNLLVLAEWYNQKIMEHSRFFDAATEKWWEPVMGGSNLMAINSLLAPYGVLLGTGVYSGQIKLGRETFHYRSGTSLMKMPRGGHLILASALTDDVMDRGQGSTKADAGGVTMAKDVAILGYLSTKDNSRIAIFGDTACLDSSQRWTRDLLSSPVSSSSGSLPSSDGEASSSSSSSLPMCLDLMHSLLRYVVDGVADETLKEASMDLAQTDYVSRDFHPDISIPRYAKDRVNFLSVSRTAARVQQQRRDNDDGFRCTLALALDHRYHDDAVVGGDVVGNNDDDHQRLVDARSLLAEARQQLAESITLWGETNVGADETGDQRLKDFTARNPVPREHMEVVLTTAASASATRFGWLHVVILGSLVVGCVVFLRMNRETWTLHLRRKRM